MTIQFGKSITTPGDPLQKIPLERLFLGIQKPKQSFRDFIEQLRMVRSMDENQYRNLKKQLPYFVCGLFHPAIRRREHFATIESFVLDLDHLEVADLSIEVLRNKLKEVPEVLMLFASPSADGLKILFRLEEPCSDMALFSSFYKLFAQRFAEKNGLEQVIDYKTSDVTRACFISFDEKAYLNMESNRVVLKDFIPDLNFDLAERDIKKAEAFLKNAQSDEVKKDKQDLNKEALLKIKQRLNPHYRQPRTKNHHVPPEVDQVLPELNDALAEFEMKIMESNPISYGRKIKVVCNQLWAELNIFYGKKGFRVVQTTKSGSNLELATLAAQAIEQILSTMEME
ncbi:MAG: CRISPR-associated primase-polymerase type B [Bacteroidetes bacterium]|nr:CRISPR-associated primase-polymerase type B [Bacteroidota bacterium]